MRAISPSVIWSTSIHREMSTWARPSREGASKNLCPPMAITIEIWAMPRLKSRAPACSDCSNSKFRRWPGQQFSRSPPQGIRRMRGRSGAIAAMLMCLVLSAAAQPLMHDLPQDTVMHAFLRVQGGEAHLLVRVPLDLLHGISWPTNHGEYAVNDSQAAVNQALDALGHAILIWQDGERLTPTKSSG